MRLSSYIASASSIPGSVREAPLFHTYRRNILNPPSRGRWISVLILFVIPFSVVLYQTWFSNVLAIGFGLATAVILYFLLILLATMTEQGR